MTDRISAQQGLCDRLRKEMHEAPMNKIFTTHEGHRFLGTHSMAWAKASRAWGGAIDKLEAIKAEEQK